MVPNLEIIHQDDHLVAINKPHGLLVHRSRIAADVKIFALQLLRDQIGKKVYPIHRLDRKTSGVLVFGLHSEAAAFFQKEMQNDRVKKKYRAIVRGFFPDKIEVDYPLTNDQNKTQDAITHFHLLKKTELPIPLGKHTSSRYSLIEAFPRTGRMHQIRKHLNHLRHPIVGDRPHGCNKQNRLFKEKWEMMTMLLHAAELTFVHPQTQEEMTIFAHENSEFKRMRGILNL